VRVEVHHRCEDFDSYRAARVKSLFNVETGANVDIVADLPLEDEPWQLGVVVGPSGSGKTSIGRRLFGDGAFYEAAGWPDDRPIVDAIAPDGGFDDVTAALAAVGLGDVPSWLRPYSVLSNGERFRADLARIIADAPPTVVVDEFTSVVDRQIAKVGAGAFAKAWRRTEGQAVLLTCHYDVLEWLEPDWIYETATHTFTWPRGSLQRPRLTIDVLEVDRSWWPFFRPHHYLTADPMPFSKTYIAVIDGEAVAHLGVGSKNYGATKVEARACRMVVMPEWQGAGVGMRFLNLVCAEYLAGRGHLPATTTQFHTSHPGLCAALRRDPKWRQISAVLHSHNRAKSARSLNASTAHGNSLERLDHRGRRPARGSQAEADEIARRAARTEAERRAPNWGGRMRVTRSVTSPGGFGGHFRAVQGFRYVGAQEARA
jgi:GNAT superfamily N-acetyltransferase